ncbi:MAG: potassium channel protein [Polyangiaceae bacterium]|nr:potassium channel protein [Polyangiaceae bacterium]
MDFRTSQFDTPEPPEDEHEQLRGGYAPRWARWSARLLFAFSALVVVVVGSGIALWITGGGEYSLFDAIFFALITVSTVGYGELPNMESHEGARAVAAITIVFGLIVLSLLQSTLTAFLVDGALGRAVRKRRMNKKVEGLRDHYIVAGCGRVGRYVAQELFRSKVEFVVVEQNPDYIQFLEEEVGTEILFIEGDATHDAVLERAGVQKARGMVTTLGTDRDNLFVTLSARTLAPELRIIAKVVNSHNEGKLRRAGASTTVAPQSIGGTRLAHELVRPGVMAFFQDMLTATDGVRFHEFTIHEGSELAEKTLSEARLREDFGQLVVGMRNLSGEAQYAPSQDDVLSPGVVLVTLGTVEAAQRLRSQI